MKNRRTGILFSLLFLAVLHSAAQTAPPLNDPDYNKPKIFADLPDKLSVRLAELETLFGLRVGAPVSTNAAAGFLLTGTVVSKSGPADPAVQTVVVKATGRLNATFTFTRIKNADGSLLYRGRMLGKAAGDALEIVNEGGAYVFRKKNYYDLINE